MNPAVFLDRDNTLIQNDGDLGDPAQVRLIQGAASAIASLRGLGYRVVVVSNQGGVARGKYGEADVDAVHLKVNELVKATSGTTIDRFYYCPFHPDGTVERYKREHPWRKPAPGMLLQAAKDLDLDLGQSWMIGDQMRDVEAGIAAGVRTILLRPDAEELTPLRLEQISASQVERVGVEHAVMPNFTARNLIEAVRIVAQQRKPEPPEEMRQREKTARKWDAGAARTGRAAQTPAQRPAAPAPAAPLPEPAKPAPTAPRPARPFRPWNAESAAPAAAPATAAPAPSPTPPAPAAPPPAAPPSDPGAIAWPSDAISSEPSRPAAVSDRQSKPVTQAAALTTNAPAPVSVAPPPLSPTAAPAPALETGPAPRPAEASAPESGVEVVLRQVLQELRNQRAVATDVTWLRFFALLLQLVVIVLVAVAYAIGTARAESFEHWMAAALLLQLGTIAALLFDR